MGNTVDHISTPAVPPHSMEEKNSCTGLSVRGEAAQALCSASRVPCLQPALDQLERTEHEADAHPRESGCHGQRCQGGRVAQGTGWCVVVLVRAVMFLCALCISDDCVRTSRSVPSFEAMQQALNDAVVDSGLQSTAHQRWEQSAIQTFRHLRFSRG
eukprot:scaffold1909_cov303-Pavlova_lutheri.AAC.6